MKIYLGRFIELLYWYEFTESYISNGVSSAAFGCFDFISIIFIGSIVFYCARLNTAVDKL